jgi:hypothetical protein
MRNHVARLLAPLILMTSLVAAAPAGAHGVAGHGLRDLRVVSELGAVTERLAGGLYLVHPRTGPPLTTHGADGPPPAASVPMTAERAPLCTQSNHQRILYGRPASAPDRLATSLPVIETTIWRMNAELDRAALESGDMHADYRVQCDATGRLAVGSFVNPGSSSFADVVDAARLSGAVDPDADHTIFYDDPTPEACGVGSFSADERLSADNENNSGGGFAVVYSDCWNPATVMHEVGHNQGAVQAGAPNSTGSGSHCLDEADVMCYADGGDRDTGTVLLCDGPERFDCGYDDYFDAAPEPGEYLASNWNLGSPLNRFIKLSALAPGEDPTYTEPGCDTGAPAGTVEDALDCGEAEPVVEEEVAEAAVRIVRGAVRLSAGRVDVVLACPAARATDCEGSVAVHRGRGRKIGRRSFQVLAGSRERVRISIAAPARRAMASALPRSLRVVAREWTADRSTSRTIAVAERAHRSRHP